MNYYENIPRLTRKGSYQINLDIGEVDYSIKLYQDKYNLEINPDFQRGHVWTKDQQVKYVEYVLKGGVSGLIIYFNHPNWMGSYQGNMICVDGLQRITALQLFEQNKLKIFNEEFGGILFSDFKRNYFSEGICFNINNLKTRQEILQWYLDLNEGGIVPSKEELKRVHKLLLKEV